MLVSPQLSAEIDRLLAQSQQQMLELVESGRVKMPTGDELTEIMLSVGDVNLMIKQTKNIWRRYYE